MIYETAFEDGYNSIDRFLGKYIQDCASGKHKDPTKAPEPRLKLVTPHMLLINRQIYTESVRFLRRKPLVFSHGLLGFDLTSLIGEMTLLAVPHIIMTDTGHNPQDTTIHRNLEGFRALARGLMYFLRTKERALQKFEINLDDPATNDHIVDCYATLPTNYNCDRRRTCNIIYQSLKCLRDIPSVSVRGWLPDLIARDLERLMTSPRNPLVELPEHIRIKIYKMVADWNEVGDAIVRYNTPTGPRRSEQPRLYTPNVFLVDRTTWSEAVRVMWETPFTLDLTGTAKPGHDDFFRYISPHLALRIRHLRLNIKHWSWLKLLGQIVKFMRLNRHVLTSLELHFEDAVIEPVCRRLRRYYPTNDLAEMFLPLYALRGLEDVMITGSLPECFTAPLARTMQLGRDDEGEPLMQERLDDDDEEEEDEGEDVVVCSSRRIFKSIIY